MNELYFTNLIIYPHLQTGPLGGYIDNYIKHISSEGYARLSKTRAFGDIQFTSF